MLRRPGLLLLGLLPVFGTLTVLELKGLFQDGQAAEATLLPDVLPASSGAKTQRAGLGAAASGERQRWVGATLARPLFAADRRPRAAVKAVARAAAVLPRLTGVLIYGDGRRALFAGADGAKPVSAAEGGAIAEYKVQRIEAGQVTLLGPDGTRVVRPTFDARAPAGLAGVPAAADGGINAPGLQRLTAVTGVGRPRASAR